MNKKNRKKRLDDQGFTLIELMVVIVILGVLAMAVAPRLIRRADDAKITRAQVDIESIKTALKLYKLDNGVYPGTEQGLNALVEPPASGQLAPKWAEGGYLEGGLPIDPWGNEYVYIASGSGGSDFDIISYGADGVSGGDGINTDISNKNE